ncbi:ligand-dependent nuclear receptor corepressor-like protein [Antedon mediterranea]|uniref:ligand-dependent nuclear receptor corepressor-like protein n=1 Tax=Antedon mediterranea TaxID=105859 RepID=UPI003AF9881A
MAASVSCGNYRCLQERKQLRKELEKSRKQFISSIGFECVVKELYGVESVKRITPFNDEETGRQTEDWDPSFAEICQLCMARKQLVKESIARHERYIDEYTGGNLDTKGDYTDGQPLDLSRAGIVEDDHSTDSPLSLATPQKNRSSLKVPFIKVKNKNKLARHGKTGTYSNYTQADLKLALIDVRSGKIGTRRASVLYGIPRSTIRNHLNRNSFLNEDESTGTANNRSNKKISPKVEQTTKDTDKAKQTKDTNTYGSVCFAKEGEDVISRLRKHLEEVEKCKTRIDGKQTVGRLLLQEMLSGQGIKAKDSDENNKISHESSLSKSVFEYLIEKHLENVNEIDQGENRENIQSQKTKSGQVDPNIRVPDFRPVNGGSDKDKPFVIEETRNNAAVINEWFKRSASPLMDMTSQEQDSVTSNTSGRSDEFCGQSKRPKRGRYRCYDRESLMQAVNAVQRGEMTVTRAGNVFGVPHSTLEYKVKERHLKRNAKRAAEEKPQTSSTHSDHSDSNQSPQAPEVFKPQRLGPSAMMYPIGNTIMPSYDSFASRLRAISERQLWHSMFPYSIDPEALRHLSESASHYYRSHPLYAGQYLEEEYYLLNERQSTSLGLQQPPRESLVDESQPERDSALPGYSQSPPVKQQEVKREKSSNINNIIEKLLEAQIYQQVQNIQDSPESKEDALQEPATAAAAADEEEDEPTAKDLSKSTRKRPTEEEEEESIPTKKSCHDDAENSQKITENIGAIQV